MKSTPSRDMSPEKLEGKILAIFKDHPNKNFNYKQVAKHLGIFASDNRDILMQAIYTLKDKGDILEIEQGKFRAKPDQSFVEGIIDITSSGAAYVVNDDFEDDIYIAPSNVKNAFHGDKVKVNIYARRKGKRMEGTVVEVLTRAKSEFVGLVQLSNKVAFLVPDGNKMLKDIFIPLSMTNGAKDGDKAICRITEWPENDRNPIGEITRVLGKPGDNETEMNAILVEYGFPLEFPPEVERDADKISFEIPEAEIQKRRDFRKITTFTIDPVDAKDFDDALSIQKLDNGNWEIGIHIADVTHYVKPGSRLEEEAYKRATSVYLVDRVIPMLPEKLSNGVCSLRPQEEKLCFSAVFEMDDEAIIVDEWFGRTVIFSDHRFAYEDAQEVIENKKGKFADELLTLDRLAKKLREARFKNGSIAFDRLEVKFILDEKGNPTGVYTKEMKDSNKLIEDFMLLANKRVATLFGKKKKGKKTYPFVYRIHDSPSPERATAFSEFASTLGYQIKTDSDRQLAKSINKLMVDIKGKGEQNVLETLAIRTMAKAVYSPENIGHYGLAFDYYSHFTSPIRRYPDMMVHRLLDGLLQDQAPAQIKDLEEKCKHSSNMEFTASSAERASIKYKQVQFLIDKMGIEFSGIISGVTEWGLYVELDGNKCEGMIRLRDISDDFYEFDEKNYCITGHRTGRKYQLGDAVKVEVKRADLVRKQIDFSLVDSGGISKKSSRNDGDFDETRPIRKGERPNSPSSSSNKWGGQKKSSSSSKGKKKTDSSYSKKKKKRK